MDEDEMVVRLMIMAIALRVAGRRRDRVADTEPSSRMGERRPQLIRRISPAPR